MPFVIGLSSLDPTIGRDSAGNGLRVLDREVREGNYVGTALSINRPRQIWQTNRAAHLDTFADRLVTIVKENGVPVISPRSEWFGAYRTDHGSGVQFAPKQKAPINCLDVT